MKSLCFAMCLLGPLSCGEPDPKRSTPGQTSPPIRVVSQTVELSEVDNIYEVTGTVRASQTSLLTSKVSGQIRKILVRAGDTIDKGQLLALIDASDVSASLSRVQAALRESKQAETEAEKGLGAAEAQAELARSTHERYSILLKAKAVAQQAYDERQTQLRQATARRSMATARLERARAGIAQARAAVDAARAMVDHTRILAPYHGRVIDRRADPGTLSTPGMTLLVVEQEGARVVEAVVEESRSSLISIGQSASVSLGDGSDERTGKVSEIVPQVDQRSRAFVVKVVLEGSDELRPGRFARVSFTLGQSKRLMIPRQAVIQRGQLRMVFALEGQRALLRLITLGQRRGEQVEVLSGLDRGERIVVSPLHRLQDGSSIEADHV